MMSVTLGWPVRFSRAAAWVFRLMDESEVTGDCKRCQIHISALFVGLYQLADDIRDGHHH